MVGALYYKLQELQFELYVARQIKDYYKQKRIEKEIKKIEEELKKGEK